MTRVPLDRFTTEAFPDAERIELAAAYRSPAGPSMQAWVAPHSSEEHAAIARELRRVHVEDGVAWGELAVIVRRQGTHLGNLLRALDDARIPRAVPERGKSLTLESATYPYVLALRWLVADAPRREDLIEPLLTSDVVGLSPAAARGLIRLAKSTGPAPRAAAAALDRTDGLNPDEASRVERARATLDKAALFAGMSVQDAFKVLWEELPCSARLVEAGGQELDTAVTFANVVAEASEQGDAGVQAFLEALDAGEHGPGWSAREVARARRRAGAHGPRRERPGVRHRAGGRRHRGQLPVVVAARADVRPCCAAADPQPLRAGPRTPGRRAAPVPDGARAGAPRGRADRGGHPPRRRRAHAALAVRRRAAGRALDGRARGRRGRARQRRRGRRGVAAPARRPRRRGVAAARRARGAARARRRCRAVVVPARLDRHRASAARDAPAVVLPAVQPRELRAAARARRRARARPRGRLPGVGRQARARHHRAHREGRARQDQGGDPGRGRQAVARRGVPLQGRVGRASPDRRDAHVQELVVPVRRGGLARERGVLLLRVRRRDDRRA